MGREFNKWVVAIIRPPLLVAGFIVSNVYSLLFGWYGKRLAREAQHRLEAEVQEYLSFLFREYDAHIIPEPEARHVSDGDWPLVVLSVDGMLLHLLRWRGELNIGVAPIHAPNDWDDLMLVLSILDESVKRNACGDLFHLAQLLKPRMALLSQALSEPGYAALKERLSEAHEYDRVVTRQWENEINRRLYN